MSATTVQDEEQNIYKEEEPPPNFSWVAENQLAAMGWPQTEANVNFLITQNIKHLITLSPERIPPVKEYHDIVWLEIPVGEYEAPTLHQVIEFIQICENCLNKEEAVGVHCSHGKGRTGVMAACYLIHFQELAPDRAVVVLRRLRPGSIETAEQERIVVQYHDYLLQRKPSKSAKASKSPKPPKPPKPHKPAVNK